MSIDELLDFVNVKYPKITILNGLDIKYRDRVNFICSEHGEFSRRFDHFMLSGCIKCKEFSRRNEQREIFIISANSKHNNKYLYDKVNYHNNKTKVTITCKEHGDFEQRPDNHLAGSGCTNCNYKLTNEDFIKRSNEIHRGKYSYNLTNYNGVHKYVDINCEKHGIFSQLARVHLAGFGCSKCSESIGETKISNILSDNNISFIREHKFDNCKNKFKLSFDFFLPDHNVCIEYNGIQHYYPVKFFGGQNSFDYRIGLDEIKKNYCLENKIKLFIISYTDEIEELINNIIIELNRSK